MTFVRKQARSAVPVAFGILLCLIAATPAANRYTVKQGDTLWDIAKAHKVSVDAILSANRSLRPEALKLGKTLVIPDRASAKTKAKTKAQPKPRSYKIQKGDTLWDIARRCGVSVSALAKANGMKENATLKPGRVLKIHPGPGSDTRSAGLNQQGVCISDRVNVRLGPGTHTERVAVIDKGKPITLLSKKDGWSQIKLAGGTKGWIRSDFVKLTPARKESVGAAIAKAAKEAAGEGPQAGESVAAEGSPAPEPEESPNARLVRTALSYRGTRYHRGGASPSAFDCSGFTMFIYSKAGINLPHSSWAMFNCGYRVAKSELQEGDLVFFRTGRRRGVSHVGICIGEGKFVHASSSGGEVRVDRLDQGYYNSRFLGARRVR